MSAYTKHLAGGALAFIGLILLSHGPGMSLALADGPAPAKGSEVSTVGTGAYTGPTAEELAKLAEVQASPETTPAPAKEPATATITASEVITLTEAEQAKLDAILAIPATPSSASMPKLGPMVTPTVGTPALTPQERAKRALELETPHQAAPPLTTPQARPADVPAASTPAIPAIADPAGHATPTAAKTAPRNDR